MSEEMKIADYLAQGGKLTNPTNVPPRYRAELLKIMSTFVDTELAGAAGFADAINTGPGIRDRIAATRIVLEKTENADKVLRIMGEFGTDTERYASQHPWSDRLPRDTAPGSTRSAHDMRLSVFNYPIEGWVDSVVLQFCMGHAGSLQLEDMVKVSYQPLADAIRDVAPREAKHTELAEKTISALREAGESEAVDAALDYWKPRVEAIFGDPSEDRMAQLKSWGLRHSTGAEMRSAWETRMAAALG